MNEVIETIKKMVADGNLSQEVAEKYFPQLKESYDEKIRKEIIEFIERNKKPNAPVPSDPYLNKWISWLEKQDGQRKQLINRACNLLVNCIEDFILRRMEIWDEECKKQTLENIRKKLEE